MNTKIILGAHLSIAGGFDKAVELGTGLGCTAIQIFTKSNRQWKSKPIERSQAQQFIQLQKSSSVAIVVAHAAYLINLGSTSPETRKKSYDALVDEIQRCNTLAIPYLILHPGTTEPGEDEKTAQSIGEALNKALDETKECTTSILVENMAGQGKSIGGTFQALANIIAQVKNKKRIGVCFDTCHAFAAGYDFSNEKNYKAMWKDFDTTIGLPYLKVLHVNDSKKNIGQRVDRHEHIGQGKIPTQAFAMLMQDPAFAGVPKILETPQEHGVEDIKKNLNALLVLVQ